MGIEGDQGVTGGRMQGPSRDPNRSIPSSAPPARNNHTLPRFRSWGRGSSITSSWAGIFEALSFAGAGDAWGAPQ